MEKPTGMECTEKQCDGEILEEIDIEFIRQEGFPIYGPESHQRWKKVLKGFHCSKCGTKYELVSVDKLVSAK